MKIWKILFPAGFVLLITTTATAENNTDLKHKIVDLERRVQQLESQKPESGPAPRTPSPALGPSRLFNPAMSVNGLFLGTYRSQENSNRNAEARTGMKIQEVELRFTANVDSYFFGDLTLSFESTDKIEIEEVTAGVLLTRNVGLKTGKFFSAFGKHNLLHTHQFPFIDAPLINEEILGEDGLNEVGGSLAVLFPLPWFSELTLQFLEGDNALFNGSLNDDFLYLAHLRNLIDITDDLTAELGGSFAYGKNDNPGGPYNNTQLAGIDLTFKWKPGGKERYRTLVWQTEFINSSREVDKKGIYTLLQYQFARRWWAQARYDFFTIPRDAVGGAETAQDKHRYSGLLAFVFSEFSALRLQYNYLNQLSEDEHQVLLQLNFTFGSHPAHSY